MRKTSMARIICDNTDEIDSIQPLAFKLQTPTGTVNAVRSCSENSIPKVNLEVFKESQSFGRWIEKFNTTVWKLVYMKNKYVCIFKEIIINAYCLYWF